jgi:LacI family transcriptional regulator
MKKKTTIKDVAKHAKVSPATVSYVLNGVKKVSDKTKQRVLDAVEELNYYPDFAAVNLSKRTSNLIGVVLPAAEESMFEHNAYYNEFVGGIELVARLNNFDTLITGEGNIEGLSQWVKKRNLDGLIYMGLFPEESSAELKALNVPTVLIDAYGEYTEHFNNVNIDDQYGGYLATKHLIALGHEKIAFVATNIHLSPVDRLRYQGYQKALREAGLPYDDRLLFEVETISFKKGQSIGETMVESSITFSGIVTVSDILAFGIIKAFYKNHLHVPTDYSIVGFDDLSISQYSIPSLTTVRQNTFGKGKTAAQLILDLIDPTAKENKCIKLPVELIERESTARYDTNK